MNAIHDAMIFSLYFSMFFNHVLIRFTLGYVLYLLLNVLFRQQFMVWHLLAIAFNLVFGNKYFEISLSKLFGCVLLELLIWPMIVLVVLLFSNLLNKDVCCSLIRFSSESIFNAASSSVECILVVLVLFWKIRDLNLLRITELDAKNK